MGAPVVWFVRKGADGAWPAMRRLVGHLGLPNMARTVVLKLNLCDYRRPEAAVNVHPETVDALGGVLRERYPEARIALCENNSTPTLVDNLWRYMDLDTVAARHRLECVNLAGGEWRPVPIRGGLHFSEIEAPALLLDADLVVNVPKLKTHGKTRITCALKNLFGCYRAKDKRPLHRFLDEAIVDINLALRPHVVVVDADLCLEGNRGPTQGLPKRLGLFAGGTDPVGVDAACARLMGFNPYLVGHIRKAWRAGVGSIRFDVCGDLGACEVSSPASPFRYSSAKFLLMQVLRRVLAWSDVA